MPGLAGVMQKPRVGEAKTMVSMPASLQLRPYFIADNLHNEHMNAAIRYHWRDHDNTAGY